MADKPAARSEQQGTPAGQPPPETAAASSGAIASRIREAHEATIAGEWEDAANRWAVVRREAPDLAAAYLEGGWALREAGRLDEADAVLSAGLERFPDRPWIAIHHAWVAMRRRDWGDAIPRWELVRTRFPDRPQGYVEGGWALREAGRFEEADSVLSAGVTRFPDEPWPAIHHGWVAMRRRDWQEAARRWEGVRQKFPDQQAGYIDGGWASLEAGRLDEADRLLAVAVERYPESYSAALHYARVAALQGQHAEAVARWQAVADRFPNVAGMPHEIAQIVAPTAVPPNDGREPPGETRLAARIRAIRDLPNAEIERIGLDSLAGEIRGILTDPEFESWPAGEQAAMVERVRAIYTWYWHASGHSLIPALERLFHRALATPESGLDALCLFYDLLYFLYWYVAPDYEAMRGVADRVMKPFAAALREGFFAGLPAIAPRPLGDGPLRIGYLAQFAGAGNPIGAITRGILAGLSGHLPGTYRLVLYAWSEHDDGSPAAFAGSDILVRRFAGNSIGERIAAVAEAIAADKIDVLLTDANSALPTVLFERRVAPVQIFYQLGLPYWPLANIDGVIRVEFYDPQRDGFEPSECFNIGGLGGWNEPEYAPPVEPARIAAERARFPPAAKLAGTYGRLAKITADFLGIIRELLLRHPQLMVVLGGTGDGGRIRDFIHQHGLTGRLILVEEYVDGHAWGHMFDIFLDTSSDATVAGREVIAKSKPVVSLRTPSMDYERVSMLIADDPQGYVETVSRLIEDPVFYEEACRATREFAASRPGEREYAAAIHEAVTTVVRRVRERAIPPADQNLAAAGPSDGTLSADSGESLLLNRIRTLKELSNANTDRMGMARVRDEMRAILEDPLFQEWPFDKQLPVVKRVAEIYFGHADTNGRSLIPAVERVFYRAAATQQLDLDTLCFFYDLLHFLYWYWASSWEAMGGVAEVMKRVAAAIRDGAVRGLPAIVPRPLGREPLQIGYLAQFALLTNPTARGVGEMLEGLSRQFPGTYRLVLYAWYEYDDAELERLPEQGITVRRFTANSISERIAAVAEAIAADQIDILITDMNTALPTVLFERRLAPVQIFFQTGLPFWPLANVDGVFRIEFYDSKLDGFEREICFDLGLGAWNQPGYPLDPPIDPARIAAERARFPEAVKLIGIYGRLAKITVDFLEIIRELLTRHPRVVALIGGTGDGAWIRDFIADHGLAGRLVLVDEYVDGHVWGHMIDVFLDTSWDVTVAGREVMAKGKPIVAMRTPTHERERLPMLIADDRETYIDLVSRLIEDRDFYEAARTATHAFVAAQPGEREYIAAVHHALTAVVDRVRSARDAVAPLGLACQSVLDLRRREAPPSIEIVEFPGGKPVEAVRADTLRYLPGRRLQVWRDRIIPSEANTDDDAVPELFAAMANDPIKREDILVEDICDGEVCLLSNLHSFNFYHFLEELYKVVILERHGFDGQYVISPLPQFATDLLGLLGIPQQRIRTVTSPVVFRSAWLTSHISHMNIADYPGVFFALRNALLAAAEGPSLGPRLWIDRTTHRTVVNRDEVNGCLQRHGFAVVEMSELPAAQQIAAVAASEMIAGPHGAGFVHSMFLPERSSVIECFSPEYVSPCILDICSLLEHRYFQITQANTRSYDRRGNIEVDCKHLELVLQSLSPGRDVVATPTPMPTNIVRNPPFLQRDLAVVSATDGNFFDLLQGMVRSLRDQPRGRDVKLYVLDIGMTEAQRRWLLSQGARLHSPPIQASGDRLALYLSGITPTRCRIPELFPGHEVYLWIDADAWIQRWDAVESYIEGALRAGFAITPETDPAYDREDVLNSHAASFAMFGPECVAGLHATGPINAGVFAGRADAPHWRAWRQMIEANIAKTDVPEQLFLLDQTTLWLVCKQYSAETAILPTTCNWVACFALPAVSDDGGILLHPLAPHEPLGIVHQADQTKRDFFALPRRSGGLLSRTLSYQAHSQLAGDEYVSPGLNVILPDRCFPNIVQGGQDHGMPAQTFLNRDEAHVLYNMALGFCGRPALAIGCQLGWSICQIALAGLDLDVVDPLLADPEVLARVRGSLEASRSPGRLTLSAATSPDGVHELAKSRPQGWPFFFIDGDHEADAPTADVKACELYATADCTMVFHGLASPGVTNAVLHLKALGWKIRVYHTAQIMAVAWRGNIHPVAHQPDPRIDWQIPEHVIPLLT